MTPDEKTIIIVSDLHLAAGTDPISGRRDLMEPFAHDVPFARWLDHLRERAASTGDRHRLLLLGDIFDFPRVRLSGEAVALLDGADEMAIARLDRIAAGHPAVFASLGRWLGAGNPIDLVPGNHDVELMRPAVHRHLSGLLARAGGLAEPHQGVNVSPWIYHVPGVLYAEHGQQYHDLNSFPALVWLEANRAGVRALPPGAAVDSLVERVTGKLGPGVDAPDSLFRLLRNVVSTGPKGVLRVIPDVVRFTTEIVRDLFARSRPRNRVRRERYRATVLPDQAARTGISPHILAGIDRLAEATANGLPARMAKTGLRQIWPNHGSPVSASSTNYLMGAASEIHQTLCRSGVATAFYVFGHSHKADQQTIGTGPNRAVYLNSGAWAWQDRMEKPLLTFLTVTWDVGRGEATASLRRWDDELWRIEPVEAPAHVVLDPAVAVHS